MVIVGGLAPDYVLDQMEFYEAEMFLAHLDLKHRSSWEQTRQLFYAICQVNSKDRLNPSELMPFPWEERETDHSTNGEDPDDVKKRMLELEKYYNNE